MNARLLTTGQAAEFCSVTPDTVRKWIYSGRLKARRTPGGHHRIDVGDLQRALGQGGDSRDHRRGAQPGRFRYCWEYNNRRATPNGCRDCVVYHLRAQRCYEVAALAPEIGHAKLFCKGSCSDCDYYRRVHRESTNVMVVTADAELRTVLERDRQRVSYNLEITDCEYNCSAIVDRFRADYVVIDSSLGPERTEDICQHLSADPRLPHVRVVLAVGQEEFPGVCDRDVFARIEKPFLLSDITRCLEGARWGRGTEVSHV